MEKWNVLKTYDTIGWMNWIFNFPKLVRGTEKFLTQPKKRMTFLFEIKKIFFVVEKIKETWKLSQV